MPTTTAATTRSRRWTDCLWACLVERDNFGPGENRAKAKEMIDQARRHYQDKLASVE